MIATASVSDQEALEAARNTLRAEAAALLDIATRMDRSLNDALDLILGHRGKVVVTGLGKSGHVGRKIAATLCSTGTPSVFLHASEATHGDLGVYAAGDPTILISKSGTTAELVRLVPLLRQLHSPLIAILGNLSSPLAKSVDVVLDARVSREADPLDLAPTASSAVALGIGDALAVALMVARGFTDMDFARFHPSGQLGRYLLLKVSDVMHADDRVAWVRPEDSLREVVIAMTEKPLGAACVVDGGRRLVGLITDGDVRRALKEFEDIRPLCAGEVMTPNPRVIAGCATLREALTEMEERESQISVLPVVEPVSRRCDGLVRIHDIHRTELA